MRWSVPEPTPDRPPFLHRVVQSMKKVGGAIYASPIMLSPVVPQQAVDGVLTPHLKALQYDGGSASSQERAQSPDYKRRTRPPAGDYYRLPCYISAGTFSVFIPNLHHIKSGIHKKNGSEPKRAQGISIGLSNLIRRKEGLDS